MPIANSSNVVVDALGGVECAKQSQGLFSSLSVLLFMCSFTSVSLPLCYCMQQPINNNNNR